MPLPARAVQRRKPRLAMAAGPEAALEILCPDPTAEDAIRDKHLDRARHLARQEDWDRLITLIGAADDARHLTPGMMPIADLLAYGARSDVVHAVEHALIDGEPAPGAPLLSGIEALEEVLQDYPDEPVIAGIVAQAHVDIGWAWRGGALDAQVPRRHRDAFAAHFDRAAEILAPHCARRTGSPLIAAAHCALLGGGEGGAQRTADRYQTLIDLNPANPRPMRAMGSHLLPRWYGSHAELELEARRTAARTEDVWGNGGYTWVQFDAIVQDDAACAALDVDFFIDGLRDILERRGDPYTVNLLAAYCANSIGQTFSGDDGADLVRSKIADCACWIVRNHLTELHPMIWAHAARGFDASLRVQSPGRFAAAGREDAMRLITSMFGAEIAAGKRIVFTDSGPVAEPG